MLNDLSSYIVNYFILPVYNKFFLFFFLVNDVLIVLYHYDKILSSEEEYLVYVRSNRMVFLIDGDVFFDIFES